MKYRDYVKQEIAVIKDRDPAIKSDKDFTENCKTDWN